MDVISALDSSETAYEHPNILFVGVVFHACISHLLILIEHSTTCDSRINLNYMILKKYKCELPRMMHFVCKLCMLGETT